MLNLLERRWRTARLSMHKMFLTAPDPVLAAIAEYLKGRSSSKGKYHQVLRAYIETNHTHTVKPIPLEHRGSTYDLLAFYEENNKIYFDGKLTLDVTWYGRSFRSKRPRRITFGLYEDPLKLIKIHKILDHPFFPPYFVSYVVYHEMVHAVVPGEMNERGQFCIHTAPFKALERQFADYERARAWEKKHIHQIFRHGRT